jgi:hypothetical protein
MQMLLITLKPNRLDSIVIPRHVANDISTNETYTQVVYMMR